MNSIRSLAIAAGLAVGLAGLTSPSTAADPGTSFTYQGVLSQNGSPVNSMRDMRFRLYDAETGGNLVETIQKFGVEYDAGQFNVELDFNGAGPWAANQQLWLEIEAGPADGSQSYEVIGRQKLTATPYSLNTRGIRVLSSGDVEIDPDGLGYTPQGESSLAVMRNGSSFINVLSPDDRAAGILFGTAHAQTRRAFCIATRMTTCLSGPTGTARRCD